MAAELNPLDVHLGTRLRSARTARRMSLDAVGRAVGVTYQQIQKYELGRNRISASTLYDLAVALGVEVSWFYDGYGEPVVPVTADRQSFVAAEALGRVGDPRVKHELEALIDVLATARAA